MKLFWSSYKIQKEWSYNLWPISDFLKNILLKASWCKIVLNKRWRFSSNATLIRVNRPFLGKSEVHRNCKFYHKIDQVFLVWWPWFLLPRAMAARCLLSWKVWGPWLKMMTITRAIVVGSHQQYTNQLFQSIKMSYRTNFVAVWRIANQYYLYRNTSTQNQLLQSF